jgi:hypothetical protein
VWKTVRVTALLLVLALVASGAWFEQRRAHAWRQTLDIGILPLAGDDSPVTRQYLAQLTADEFTPINRFFAQQGRDFGVKLQQPVRSVLFPVVTTAPPEPPRTGGVLATVWWSLELRYYAWRFGSAPGQPTPPVRMFVVYHDPARAPRLPHSAGLQKGLIGVANVFAVARMRGSNNVVIAHEFLHTLGATDKYDPATDAPVFPAGYGDPAQDPRYPQEFAEIMAGRRALSPTAQEMPESLEQCVIGPVTASEIHWPGG